MDIKTDANSTLYQMVKSFTFENYVPILALTATVVVRDEVKFICRPKSQGMGGWVPKNRTTIHAGRPDGS